MVVHAAVESSQINKRSSKNQPPLIDLLMETISDAFIKINATLYLYKFICLGELTNWQGRDGLVYN